MSIDATKVYSLESYDGGTISAAEAAYDGINTNDLQLASIEACRTQIHGYIGPIEVLEGIFEFGFDTGIYVQINPA